MSRTHLSLPNAYKLMCFDRNINGNKDVKFLECDYLSCVMVRETHFSDTNKLYNGEWKLQNRSLIIT